MLKTTLCRKQRKIGGVSTLVFLTSFRIHHAFVANSFSLWNKYSKLGYVNQHHREYPSIRFALDSVADCNNDVNSLIRTIDDSIPSVVIREMELKDIPDAVNLCMEEYGPKPRRQGKKNGIWHWDYDTMIQMWDRWALSTVVCVGFQQRIERGDHCVICLERTTTAKCSHGEEESREIVAIAEVSLQPPYSTAPPLPLPLAFKQLWAAWEYYRRKPSSLPFECCPKSMLQAYISNVLVKESERGKGYGKQIMVAAEQQALRMGYNTVTLHVDAHPTSGKVAHAMYTGLGYQPIVQMCSQGNPPSPSQEYIAVDGGFTSAIHFVDGVPLFYMYKTIHD